MSRYPCLQESCQNGCTQWMASYKINHFYYFWLFCILPSTSEGAGCEHASTQKWIRDEVQTLSLLLMEHEHKGSVINSHI